MLESAAMIEMEAGDAFVTVAPTDPTIEYSPAVLPISVVDRVSV